jgi:two-component system OmpR family sensor kinase
MSLRARLLAVLAVLSITGLLVADIVTYTELRSFLIERTDRSLTASAKALEAVLARQHGFVDRGDFAPLEALTPGIFIEGRDESGRVVGSRNISALPGEPVPDPELPAVLPAPGADNVARFTVGSTSGGGSFRVRSEHLLPPLSGTLVVAVPLKEVDATLNRLVLIEILVSIAIVIAIVLLGLWLVGVGLRPLRKIEDTAAAIAAGDLSRRIEDANPRTEVGRLGGALNTMLGQIEEAFDERAASEQRLRRFVADASHELRTPLSAVQAYAELFDRGARDRPEDLERAMAGIERESVRMGVLVDDLLLLARLDQGRPLERRSVDLAEIACEAVDAARALEPERPIELDAPDELTLVGDPDRLRQVLDNLLANVRAHVPAHARVTVSACANDSRAVLAVADEGPGLSEEQAARVFERFYRADPSRSRDRGGSGLGLAIVAAIAAAHGGTATVNSQLGRGTTFTVELPLASAPESPSPVREAPTPAGAA